MSAVEFSLVARLLMDECRRLGLQPPAFRHPPRLRGQSRSVLRAPEGCVVAVEHRRDAHAVTADMIEGVIRCAPEGTFPDAAAVEQVRAALWASVAQVAA